MVEPRRLYVDGAWVAGEGGVRANRSLRDGRLLAQVGQASLAVNPSSPSYAGQLAWRSIIPTRSPRVIQRLGRGQAEQAEDAGGW